MDVQNIKILAGSSHPELVQQIRSKLGITTVDNDIQYFSNTEIRPLIKSSMRGNNVYIIQTGTFLSDDLFFTFSPRLDHVI